ncbi:unnamed protein product, partial [Timema podura]|nr:unnamed protein product [Timema podura]
MIDYVLSTTGESSLYFVGHSMGATIAVVLLSERPEYNEKLKITILLAPVVRLRHNTSIFRHSSPLWKALQVHWLASLRKRHRFYWGTSLPFSRFCVVNLPLNIRQVWQRWLVKVARSSFLTLHTTIRHN